MECLDFTQSPTQLYSPGKAPTEHSCPREVKELPPLSLLTVLRPHSWTSLTQCDVHLHTAFFSSGKVIATARQPCCSTSTYFSQHSSLDIPIEHKAFEVHGAYNSAGSGLDWSPSK